MRPLHEFNQPRLDVICHSLKRRFAGTDGQLDGISILDVGCGGGLVAEPLARLGASVTGIDVADKNIHVARAHAEQSGLDIDYRITTAEDLAQSGAAFDVVLSLEVVEHVADLPIFMSACCGLVKPGGLMFVATINRTVQSYLAAIIGAEYVLRLLPRGTHQWRRFPRPDEIDTLLRRHGLVTERRIGMGYRPWSRRKWQVTSDISVNYMMQTRRPDRSPNPHV